MHQGSVEVDRDPALRASLPELRLPDDEDFEAWAQAALARGASTPPAGGIAIRIVDEAEGRALNAAWRDRDSATNVLSFPADLSELPAEAAAELLLGDLVFCAPVVVAEAAAQGKAEAAHWAHLTVHGVLHLLGHDHQEAAEAEAMEALEREVLAALGFPDPYA